MGPDAANSNTVFSAVSSSASGQGGGTALVGASGGGTGVHGSSDGSFGVEGSSTSYIGVYCTSSSYIGVWGQSNATNAPASVARSLGNSTGLQGVSGASLPTAKPKTGVYGYAAQDGGSRGVTGETTAGIGVYGIATTGYGVYSAGKVYTTKWYELTEISTPASPAANRARLFLKDNGLGKTQLCVKFANGTVKILATEG